MAIRFEYIGITVSDIIGAARFFGEGLQLPRLHEGFEEADGTRRVRFTFPRSGAEVHVLQCLTDKAIDANHANPGTAHIAFYTDDIDKAFADMERHGARLCSDEIVQIVGGVFDGGKALYCAGPDGIRVELMQGPVYLDGTERCDRAELQARNANEATHFGVHVRDRDASLAFWRDLLGMRSVAEWTEASAATRSVIGYPQASLHMAILRLLQTQSFCEVIEYRGTAGQPVERARGKAGAFHFAFSIDAVDAADLARKAGALGLECLEDEAGLSCIDRDGFHIRFVPR
ncbi:MAG: VOC family protein [Novosphingobium sp.]